MTDPAQEELERTSSALAWSALAAGLSIGFSLVAEGALGRKTGRGFFDWTEREGR